MTARTAICQLSMPAQDGFYDQVIANHRGATRMAQMGTHAGRSVVICGAGPSLREADLPPADEVWACNSALPFLMDRGLRVTHGFAIDQGRAMIAETEWARPFDVAYYLASSVHPDLVRHLRDAGRDITFFHSFLGTPEPADWIPREGFGSYEDWLYRKLYPASICVGQGLNSAARAICLALAMGFDWIEVYGADCACVPDLPAIPCLPGEPSYAAWLDGAVMYADGRTARWYGDDTPMVEATLEGRRWHTRPDMAVSASQMLRLQREYPNRIVFRGSPFLDAMALTDPARLPVLDQSRILNFAAPEIPELVEV